MHTVFSLLGTSLLTVLLERLREIYLNEGVGSGKIYPKIREETRNELPRGDGILTRKV